MAEVNPAIEESVVADGEAAEEVIQVGDTGEAIKSECGQVELAESLVREIQRQQPAVITDKEDQIDEIVELKAALLAREKEVKEKDAIIAQLTDTTREQTSKINTLAKQLIKVETLLQRLSSKRSDPNHSAYRTPESRKLALDIDAVQETTSLYNQLSNSHRSNKHESYTVTLSRNEGMSYGAPSPMASGMSYGARSPMASPYRKKMDSGELSRYRREKLMEMQTVGDVLKMEKMMNGY